MKPEDERPSDEQKPRPRKVAYVMTEAGPVSLHGSAEAVDAHIAFVKRNLGK